MCSHNVWLDAFGRLSLVLMCEMQRVGAVSYVLAIMKRQISTEFALSTCYNTGYYRMGGIMTWLVDR